MKRNSFKRGPLLVGGVVAGVALWLVWPNHYGVSKAQAAQPLSNATNPELTALQTENARLKSIATDQSHVMTDVGYHFANLWFAGQKQNWPLAKFYFEEARSHINWAVRVIPIRKDSAGREVDLKAIWLAVDSSLFTQIGAAIEQKNSDKFNTAYRDAMAGCYACHKASSKPYLRPQIPKTPPQPMINFDPEAKSPE
ncbi:MAG: hypothetical protein ABI651_04350 [Verrucomicrobiota bacterium]